MLTLKIINVIKVKVSEVLVIKNFILGTVMAMEIKAKGMFYCIIFGIFLSKLAIRTDVLLAICMNYQINLILKFQLTDKLDST